MVKKYTIGLLGFILKAIRKPADETKIKTNSTNQPIKLTNDQFEVKKKLDACVSLTVE